jgi:hypothetical protein
MKHEAAPLVGTHGGWLSQRAPPPQTRSPCDVAVEVEVSAAASVLESPALVFYLPPSLFVAPQWLWSEEEKQDEVGVCDVMLPTPLLLMLSQVKTTTTMTMTTSRTTTTMSRTSRMRSMQSGVLVAAAVVVAWSGRQ